MKQWMGLLVVAMLGAGCEATVGTGAAITVPHDSGNQCAGMCQHIGMSLDSVVIMANNVGCVCRAMPTASAPPGEVQASSANSSSAGGGMAAIMMQRQAAQNQNAAAAPHHY